MAFAAIKYKTFCVRLMLAFNKFLIYRSPVVINFSGNFFFLLYSINKT